MPRIYINKLLGSKKIGHEIKIGHHLELCFCPSLPLKSSFLGTKVIFWHLLKMILLVMVISDDVPTEVMGVLIQLAPTRLVRLIVNSGWVNMV
jgi:hypothetical protein